MIKQVIIARKDLHMRKGKLASQCCHASMKVFFDRMNHFHNYAQPPSVQYLLEVTPAMQEWIDGTFTKIVVGCNSLDELNACGVEAAHLGIPYAVIEDMGKTEFKEPCPKCDNEEWTGTFCDRCNNTGKINKQTPTITCLAIGPDDAEKIDKITGHLELL